MSKGKFGINLTAIAVIAFVFTALRNPQAILLVVGFALLAERDEWLGRQTMQALLLNLAYALTTLVVDWIFGRITWFFVQVELYKASKFFSDAAGYVTSALYVAMIVLCVIAVIRVIKGKEANLPLLSKMAGGGNAGAREKAAPQSSPAPQASFQPTAPIPQPAPPPSVPQPAPPPSVPQPAPQAEPRPTPPQGRFCAGCGNTLSADAMFCNECGAKQ